MITLSIILTLYCVFGWSYKYYKSRNDEDYDMNPFEQEPNLFSFSLVLSTIFLIAICIGLMIKYLP